MATSVAARGLDVKQLILVVNYDCPNHYEDYVHRCGRTGRAGNKGFAYTFIAPDQERTAGDIIKALEQSNKVVPTELQALWDRYRCKLAAEGKTVRSGGGGFSGKGFKFDESEAQAASEKKKFQKAALGTLVYFLVFPLSWAIVNCLLPVNSVHFIVNNHSIVLIVKNPLDGINNFIDLVRYLLLLCVLSLGLQDSDDDDVENDLDEEIEKMMSAKRIVREVQTDSPAGPRGVGSAASATAAAAAAAAAAANKSAVADKFEMAKKIALKINMKNPPIINPAPTLQETSFGALTVRLTLSTF